MSGDKLLLDEYPLIILPQLAVAIGLNEAIVLQQIHYWLVHYARAEQDEEVKPHFKDGRWWIYNTVEEWTAQFPFWSYDTVKRALVSLRKSCAPGKETGRVARGPLLLTTSKYNKAGFDNTLWYTIDYDEVEGLPQRIGQSAPADGAGCPNQEGKTPQPVEQNAPVEEGRLTHAIPETTIDHPETTQETTATDSNKDEKRKPRPTGNDAVAAVAPGRNDEGLLKKALVDAGIKGRKRQEILSLDDPPHDWDVFGWAYYAYAQEWPSNPPGVVIDHLLDPDERHDPPEPFKQFGVEHLGPVIAARALAEAYRNEGYGYRGVVSSLGGDFQKEWHEYFGQYTPDELPLPNPAAAMWHAESRALQAGLDRLADSGVCLRWKRAWQDFVSRQTPMTRDAWSAVNAATIPLGYSEGVLVAYVSDVVIRATVEEHRSEFEAAVGERVQFTAAKLAVPAGGQGTGEEAEGPPVDDSVNMVIRGNWTAGSVWAAALGELQLQMTQATFDTWLRDSRLLRYGEGAFVVGVKSGYARDWLEHRLLATVKRTLVRLAGQPIEVQFVVEGESPGG